MRACSVCGRLFEDAEYCHADGHRLAAASQVPRRSEPDDPRVGQLLIERYEVFRVVADGGMGRVYEALDRTAHRQVALKILHEEVARDEVSVERFKREYEVSGRLPHTHIVEVLDFRPTSDGSQVLVMEFLAGEELRATLKREKRLAPARVVRLVSQLALAMDPAHELGLVHRDLKPDNVFLCHTPDGDVVKVLDFGSVKQRGAAKQLTILGTTIGSPFYMSPEQAQGLSGLDHRADVWAVNAVAYEALTGTLPFVGTNAPSILLSILSKDPVPPSQVLEWLPKALDSAVAHGFDKDQAHRTPSVGDLADAFGAAFGLEGSHTVWAVTPESELAARIAASSEPLRASPESNGDFFRASVREEAWASTRLEPRKRSLLWVAALSAVLLSLVAAYFLIGW